MIFRKNVILGISTKCTCILNYYLISFNINKYYNLFLLFVFEVITRSIKKFVMYRFIKSQFKFIYKFDKEYNDIDYYITPKLEKKS